MIVAVLLLLAGAQEPVAVLRHEPAKGLELWRSLPEARPALRGFRVPILNRAEGQFFLELPKDATDTRVLNAARTVATRLARDGLRATLVAAIQDVGSERAKGEVGAAWLESIGFPVDLLSCWAPPGAEPLHERVVRQLDDGWTAKDVTAGLNELTFDFAPTIPGWRVATESGEVEAGAVRLQVSSASDYAQPGEGGAMDVFRELARLLPDAEIVASVETRHLAGLEREARALAGSRRAPITLIEEPLPVAQWAQDNAKAGFVGTAGQRTVAWLAPRYASRGEDGTTFVPGENLAVEGFAATGRTVAMSRLLFQGGDILCVQDPRDGTRFLLVGESEVARNRALGLTLEEVLAALRAEFSADRCVVLPAVSFHVDLEVTVRATQGGLVACVLDTTGAARTIIQCGLDALESAGFLDAEAKRAARADLDQNRHAEFFARVGPVLQPHQHAGGRFALTFAERFASGPADSGVGNLQRFLLALDLWAAARIGQATAEDLGVDPDSFAYLDSLRRRELDRMRVANALEALGWTVVPVPGLSDGTRSLNPLNGLQLAGRYLMPAYGGLFAPLDTAARESFTRAFGAGVRIDPVACGETQRRAGGVHCAAAVEPRP